MPTAKKGFYLTELLMIVVIIAILLSILLPVVYRARVKNRETTCLDNQRSIAMSILMSAQECDATLPESQHIWQELSFPPETLRCPSAKKTIKNAYVYNELVSGLSIDRIYGADTTPVIADGEHRVRMHGECANVAYSDNDLAARHDNATIVGYLDGHASLEKDAHFGLETIVEDFEHVPDVAIARDGIYRKDSSVRLSKQTVFAGKRCLEIHYHLTTIINSFVAPLLPGPKISIPMYRISMMVKGDGSQQELALRLLDAHNEIFEFLGDPQRCDNRSWHQVIFDLRRDTMHRAARRTHGAHSDGIMQYPVRFWEILVRRTDHDAATKGRIFIDDISIWSSRRTDKDSIILGYPVRKIGADHYRI